MSKYQEDEDFKKYMEKSVTKKRKLELIQNLELVIQYLKEITN